MSEPGSKGRQPSTIDNKSGFKKKFKQPVYTHNPNPYQSQNYQYGKKLNQVLYVEKKDFPSDEKEIQSNQSFQALDKKSQGYQSNKIASQEEQEILHKRNLSLESRNIKPANNKIKKQAVFNYTKDEILLYFTKQKMMNVNFLKLQKQYPDCFTSKILYPHNIAIQFNLNKDEWWYDANKYQHQKYQKQGWNNQQGYGKYQKDMNNNNVEEEEDFPEWAEETPDEMNIQDFEFKTFEKSNIQPQQLESPSKQKQLKSSELLLSSNEKLQKQNDSQFNLNKFIEEELKVDCSSISTIKKESNDDYYSQIDVLMDQKIKNGLFEINEEDEMKQRQIGNKEEEEMSSSNELSFDDDNQEIDQQSMDEKNVIIDKQKNEIAEKQVIEKKEERKQIQVIEKKEEKKQEQEQELQQQQEYKEFKLEDFFAQTSSLLEMELQKGKNQNNYSINDFFKNKQFFNFGQEETKSEPKEEPQQQAKLIEKQEKKGILEQKLYSLEERITTERPQDDGKFKSLKDQMIKLQEQIEAEKENKEFFDEKKSGNIKTLEDNLLTALEEEKSNKKFVEGNLLKKLDEKFLNMNLNISQNNKIYQENKDSKLKDVQMQMENVRDSVAMEKKKREESTNVLVDQISAEITKFHEMLLIEKKVREETQSKIFKMIEDINYKLQTEIMNETRERENTTESLLHLLEDTCQKIDKNFKSY